jgi:hypothetical protein
MCRPVLETYAHRWAVGAAISRRKLLSVVQIKSLSPQALSDHPQLLVKIGEKDGFLRRPINPTSAWHLQLLSLMSRLLLPLKDLAFIPAVQTEFKINHCKSKSLVHQLLKPVLSQAPRIHRQAQGLLH